MYLIHLNQIELTLRQSVYWSRRHHRITPLHLEAWLSPRWVLRRRTLTRVSSLCKRCLAWNSHRQATSGPYKAKVHSLHSQHLSPKWWWMSDSHSSWVEVRNQLTLRLSKWGCLRMKAEIRVRHCQRAWLTSIHRLHSRMRSSSHWTKAIPHRLRPLNIIHGKITLLSLHLSCLGNET